MTMARRPNKTRTFNSAEHDLKMAAAGSLQLPHLYARD
jgi:hypothetical protein